MADRAMSWAVPVSDPSVPSVVNSIQLGLLLALVACVPERRETAAADLVFRRAAVYTMDAARSWASAVAVRDGRIVYVGSDSLPPGILGPNTEVVDLRGKMVLPGFQDGHVHPI